MHRSTRSTAAYHAKKALQQKVKIEFLQFPICSLNSHCMGVVLQWDEQPSEIWPACNSYHSVLYNFRFQRKLSRGIVFGQWEVVPQIVERGITVGANGSSSSIKASIRSQVILSGNIQQPGAS